MRDRLRGWRFARRLRQLAASDLPELQAYAQASWPDAQALVSDSSLLALDFELDGLSANAHVLQAGWIAFDTRGIPLANAQSFDVRSHRRLNDAAVTVHGIGEERARAGEPVSAIILELVQALQGRIIVAHGASIERSVIERTTRSLFGTALPVRAICTLALERRLSPGLAGHDAYRLAATRRRYNLPDYAQHDALSDAIAAAELFLAQLARLRRKCRLGRLEQG